MTAALVREILNTVVNAHGALTFYTILSPELDKDNNPVYPCFVLGRPTSTLTRNDDGGRQWSFNCAFEVRDEVRSDRTEGQAWDAYSRAEKFAREIIGDLIDDYEAVSPVVNGEEVNFTIGDVVIGTEFDVGTDQYQGVICGFTMTSTQTDC